MTHPHIQTPGADNPFDQPAAPSKGRMMFGPLRIVTNKVDLEKGALYIVDALGIDPDPNSPLNRITDESGNLREFKGKRLTPSGQHTHVIVVITTRSKDGQLYNACRDFLYWDRDKSQKVTMPSLRAFFGRLLEGVTNGKSAEVQAEIVEIPDKQWTRQAFKVVKVFKDQAEREAAETAFFSQFNQAQTPNDIVDEMLGEDPIPFGNDDDKPVGMTKEAAVALLPTLWTASGQDKAKFIAQLSGMPVVLTALGGADAPEVVAIYS